MRIKILIILIIILLPFDLVSQKKSEQLKRQERALIKKIENTKSLLNETKKNEALTIGQLNIIRNQISYRDRLIRNYNAQIRKIDRNINDINRQINTLLNTNNVLIQEYKNMLVYAYKNRNPSYKFLYIISASTFSEAFRRIRRWVTLFPRS